MIALVIISILILTLYVVYSEISSFIGEKGRIAVIIQSIMSLLLGITLNVLAVSVYIKYKQLIPTIFLVLIGILSLVSGTLKLIRTDMESSSNILVSELVQCEIIDYSRNIKGRLVQIRGTSINNMKNTFTFFGKDMDTIKKAVYNGVRNFEIQYYEKSGRVYSIQYK